MEPIAYHLLLQLIRRGDLDQSDIDEMAARLDAEGAEDEAHAVRAAPLEAFPESEAEFRRSKLTLIRNEADGGNVTS